MRAIVRDAYGSSDVLRLEEVDTPSIAADEVLIRVRASSINAGDRLMMVGEPLMMRLAIGPLRPKSRGMGQDAAGEVEAVGADVTDFAPGDAVFGEITMGATWAEYAVASAAKLASMPADTSFEGAASLPVAGMTALEAVRDQGKIEPGQSVLINGGSGGVGSYAIQIARAFGAEVTAVCSAANAERARELGAAHVIDYRSEDFTDGGRRFDVLLDVAGSRTLSECLSVLKPRGTYVSVGGTVDRTGLGFMLKMLAHTVRGWFVSQRVRFFVTMPKRESLEALAELIESAKLVPVVDRTCGLADVPAAIRAHEDGTESGKVAVTIGE